ncbi:unnamed protein product, partial [Brassica rapa]
GPKPKQGEPVEEEETRPYHASDRPAINEHASKRVPSASTGAREGHDGAPPTAESKRQKPINQSEANREAVNDGRSETQIKMKPGSTRRIAGENDADEATVSRRQKPAKLVPNKPPLPGDRAGRPPMEI